MGVAKGRILLGWAVAACCMLAVPAAASADVHCVFTGDDPSVCPAGSVEHGQDLQGALDAAASDATAPSVWVGVGTFDPPQNATSFTYSGSLPLTIDGQGNSTTLSAGLTSQSAAATVDDMSVSVPAGGTGVDLRGGGTVDGLTIGAPAGVGNVRGVSVGAPSLIDNTTIAFDPTQPTTAGVVDSLPVANGTVRVRDSDITAADGVQFLSKLVLAVARSTLTGATGVDEVGGGTTTVTNSVIVKTVPGGDPISYQSTSSKTLSVTNVTAVDLAEETGDAAVRANPSGLGNTTNVDVADSVLSGFDEAVDSAPTFPATVVTDLTRDERYGSLAETPDFIDPANQDFHLRADSILIDRAPDSVTGSVDRDLNPRSVDARGIPLGPHRDLGAYEFQPHAPTVALSTSNSSPGPNENVTFSAKASDPDVGDDLHYLWSFDGAPAVTDGPSVTRAFSTPGPHTATVTVVDLSRRSASDEATVVVPAPPAPPVPTQPQQQSPAPTQQQPASQAPQLRIGVCINAFNGTPGADRLTGSQFGDAIVGGGGNDILKGLGGDDCVIGDEGNDKLSGGDGDDDLRGLAGNDTIRGGNGNDNLLGGSGKDVLDGGAGNDALNGGGGVDRFKGGSGNDTINSADGKRETVDCGTGRHDSVKADRIDKLISCEKQKLVGPPPKKSKH